MNTDHTADPLASSGADAQTGSRHAQCWQCGEEIKYPIWPNQVMHGRCVSAFTASLAQKARRYDWLRSHPTFMGWEHDFRAEEIDAAIDAAIAASVGPPRASTESAQSKVGPQQSALHGWDKS